MKRYKFMMVLPVVACSVLIMSACTNRTILHGLQAKKSTEHIIVWFVKSKNGEPKVVPVSHALLPGNKLEIAVRELLRGPTADEIDSGLGTEIPRGTILLGITEHGGNVELNLSRRFTSGGGSSSFETRLAQLSKTIQSANHGKKVYLDIEGQRLSEASGEGLEVKQPIN